MGLPRSNSQCINLNRLDVNTLWCVNSFFPRQSCQFLPTETSASSDHGEKQALSPETVTHLTRFRSLLFEAIVKCWQPQTMILYHSSHPLFQNKSPSAIGTCFMFTLCLPMHFILPRSQCRNMAWQNAWAAEQTDTAQVIYRLYIAMQCIFSHVVVAVSQILRGLWQSLTHRIAIIQST